MTVVALMPTESPGDTVSRSSSRSCTNCSRAITRCKHAVIRVGRSSGRNIVSFSLLIKQRNVNGVQRVLDACPKRDDLEHFEGDLTADRPSDEHEIDVIGLDMGHICHFPRIESVLFSELQQGRFVFTHLVVFSNASMTISTAACSPRS